MSYPSSLLGTGVRDYADLRRAPLATDTCFACGKSRVELPKSPTGKDVLFEVHRTLRTPGAPAREGELGFACVACVTFYAQVAGLIGATPRHELTVRCTDAAGGRCPFGAEVALSPEPLSPAVLVKALHVLGWACSPKATLFTCPRCVARTPIASTT